MRKRRLTPIQGRLLFMLEEAGAEELRGIVATLELLDIPDFENEVKSLLRAGLIALYRDLDKPGYNYVELSEAEVRALPSFAVLVTQHEPTRLEGIMLTRAGEAAISE